MIQLLSLSEMSLLTSGVYERYYTVDGKNYHHIVDPDTLMPSDEYLSVSIVCADSEIADAYSTAVSICPWTKERHLLNSRRVSRPSGCLRTALMHIAADFRDI